MQRPLAFFAGLRAEQRGLRRRRVEADARDYLARWQKDAPAEETNFVIDLDGECCVGQIGLAQGGPGRKEAMLRR